MKISPLRFSGKATALVALALYGCTLQDHIQQPSEADLKSRSVTPVLVKKLSGFENLDVFALLSSDDKLDQSPNYIFGGSADGAGLLKNNDNTYTMLVNNEDNFAVSRLTFDQTFKPVKGEYLLNSDGAQWRLCSATMATPAEHGFGPLFLTCGESGEESRIHALNPYGDPSSAGVTKEKPALGRQSAENAVPLPKTAFPGKTVIVIGDDDSAIYGGQILVYISNTVGDLDNGSYYIMRRKDLNQKEMAIKTGEFHDVEFVKIDNQATLTGLQINQKVDDVKAIKFGRVEDVDYRKGGGANGREVYFTVTGQNNTGVNADYSRSKYGRIYRLTLDAADPTKGKLELLIDGDDRNGIAKQFQDPDNILVTENYAYIQEDPNGYGDETHDAYIYQYNLTTGALKPVFELDHRRNQADAAKYNVGGTSKFGDWESSGIIDISDIIGIPNTFVFGVQAHTWTDDKYKGVDGGSKRTSEKQASQLVIVKGLPR
ncbi:hypothetical protein GCM10028803_48880 [Larkinella knui]|uniref:DUF839 domain-containing protein n=1 Tax=Larkinella knui TaxID=2025310 RepID=A0A3P1CQC4_9BACT|nr:alkaline phosphatase PhoX [Larkinella knui]RRB15459.1 hypothetical protein EHT87_13110 [Larkinella knui]